MTQNIMPTDVPICDNTDVSVADVGSGWHQRSAFLGVKFATFLSATRSLSSSLLTRRLRYAVTVFLHFSGSVCSVCQL